jgi:hypothetical protein
VSFTLRSKGKYAVGIFLCPVAGVNSTGQTASSRKHQTGGGPKVFRNNGKTAFPLATKTVDAESGQAVP